MRPPLVCFTAIGNPENAYRYTRHNAGMLMLRTLHKELCPNALINPSKISPDVAYCSDPTKNIAMLFNVSQYMNLSGHSMIPIWRKLPHDTVHVVLHDELNIPIGKVQFRKPGTSFRGHNGLRDLIKIKGDDKFYKLGIGIDRPDSRDPKIVAAYVLDKFTPSELQILESESLQKTLGFVRKFLK